MIQEMARADFPADQSTKDGVESPWAHRLFVLIRHIQPSDLNRIPVNLGNYAVSEDSRSGSVWRWKQHAARRFRCESGYS